MEKGGRGDTSRRRKHKSCGGLSKARSGRLSVARRAGTDKANGRPQRQSEVRGEVPRRSRTSEVQKHSSGHSGPTGTNHISPRPGHFPNHTAQKGSGPALTVAAKYPWVERTHLEIALPRRLLKLTRWFHGSRDKAWQAQGPSKIATNWEKICQSRGHQVTENTRAKERCEAASGPNVPRPRHSLLELGGTPKKICPPLPRAACADRDMTVCWSKGSIKKIKRAKGRSGTLASQSPCQGWGLALRKLPFRLPARLNFAAGPPGSARSVP